jgi:hypothetical protein
MEIPEAQRFPGFGDLEGDMVGLVKGSWPVSSPRDREGRIWQWPPGRRHDRRRVLAVTSA